MVIFSWADQYWTLVIFMIAKLIGEKVISYFKIKIR